MKLHDFFRFQKRKIANAKHQEFAQNSKMGFLCIKSDSIFQFDMKNRIQRRTLREKGYHGIFEFENLLHTKNRPEILHFAPETMCVEIMREECFVLEVVW